MGTRKTAGFLLVAAVAASALPGRAVAEEPPAVKPRTINFSSEGVALVGLECEVTGVGAGTVEAGEWSSIELDVHFSCPAPAPAVEPPAVEEAPAG